MPNETNDYSFVKVNELKLENPKNVLTGNLYVNSLRYKSS